MNKLILFSAFLFFCFQSWGQEPITFINRVVDTTHTGNTTKKVAFYELDIFDNCKEAGLWELNGNFDDVRTPIAYLPNGDLVLLHSILNGFISQNSNFARIDIEEQTVDSIGRIEGLFNPSDMKAASDSVVYIIDWTLKKYNILTNELIDLGMPEINGTPVNGLGFLTFINGELYATAGTSFISTNSIIKINLDDLTRSELIIEKDFLTEFSMMTTMNHDCDSSFSIVTINARPGFDVYQLGLDDRSLTYMCHLPPNSPSLAHSSEALRFDCIPVLDLNEPDSFGIIGLDYQADTICIALNQTIFPLEAGLPAILTNTVVDSIWIGITDGATDGSKEWIDCTSNCSNSGKGILFKNSGREQNETFLEQVKQSLFYKNIAAPATGGMRQLAFVTFKKSYRSDTSYLWMPVQAGPDAGNDGDISLCRDANPIDLFAQLSGTPMQGGSWSSGTGFFDPEIDQTDVYNYTVPGGLCPAKTASVTVTVNELPQFSLGSDIVLCSGTLGMLEPNRIGSSYQWQDGSPDEKIDINTEGLYWLELTDSLGCHARDTVIVTTGEHVQKDSIVEGCPGDFFTFEGSIFKNDTMVCVLKTSSDGCDSTFCLDIRFNSDFSETKKAGICEEEVYDFYGKSYAQAGIYEQLFISETGCDSLEILDLEVSQLPIAIIEGETEICYPSTTELSTNRSYASYVWSSGGNDANIAVGAGEYEVTVTDENGCSGSAEIVIHYKKCEHAYIPNAFSPNGDFINEEFEVYVNSYVEWAGMKIFDRWGGQVFEGGAEESWDGTWQGKNMSPGIYVYLVELVLPNGDRILQKGEVHLMR